MNIQQLKQRLIDQQAEAVELLNAPSLIQREQMDSVLSSIESKLITVIVGIRRCGKSTLALQAHKNKSFFYFNFDDEILSQIKTEHLQTLIDLAFEIQPKATHLIFDEIQNIDRWEFFINRLQRKRIHITLTGSNSRLLSSELATHLTGRHISIEVLPLSFTEFLRLTKKNELILEKNPTSQNIIKIQSEFRNYIENGGFPEIYQFSNDTKIKDIYIKDLYDKILTRDVAQRRKIKNIKILKEIALLCQSHVASRFTYQSFKKTTASKSLSTIKNYVDYIEESYLNFIVQPFSFKVKERVSLPKKMYSIDSLILKNILKNQNTDFGKKLENLVYLELRRQTFDVYTIIEPTYEVDFCIREGRNITELIQVCWDFESNMTKEREIKSLINAYKKYKSKKLKIITYATEEVFQYDKSLYIEIIPAWKWVLELRSSH